MGAVSVVIHRVRRDGAVERLGAWDRETRTLRLERAGFPFLGAGEHRIEGDLPWLFWEMCPAGFAGRRLARLRPDLGLTQHPQLWSADDCERALLGAGSDLPGNLLIGERSVDEFHRWRFDARDVSSQLQDVVKDAALQGDPSSVGGERPKLSAYRADGSAYLVKFSPPVDSQLGRRWSDLLGMEALCGRVLREVVGLESATSRAVTVRGRTTLHVDRYDRLKGRGRCAVSTLYWLAMGEFGDVTLPAPEVMRRLSERGLVDAASVDACSRAHAFSAAVGNNDAHLGNYGLLFDDDGTARLAPLYDVLPMALAPRNDELPDEWLTPRPPPEDATVRAWFTALTQRVLATSALSHEFIETWLRLFPAS